MTLYESSDCGSARYSGGRGSGRSIRGQRKIAINPPPTGKCRTFSTNEQRGLNHIWYYAYFLMLWEQSFRVPYAVGILCVILSAGIPRVPRQADYINKRCCEITWSGASATVSKDGVLIRLLPLWVCMSLSALFDYCALRRHSQIIDTLNRRVYVCINHVENRAVATTRSEVTVGQILRLKKHDEVPADCLILSTSNPDGTMRVGGGGLSGSSSNMRRVAIRETRSEITTHAIRNMRGEIQCENLLDNRDFRGILRLKDHPRGAAIDPRALLRTGNIVNGCEWCYVIVAFTGVAQDTLKNRPSRRLRHYQFHKARPMELRLNARSLVLVALSLIASLVALLIRLKAADNASETILPLAVGVGWTSKTLNEIWPLVLFHIVVALDASGQMMCVMLDMTQFVCTRATERDLRSNFLQNANEELRSTDVGATKAESENGTDKVVPSRVAVCKADVVSSLASVDLILADKSSMLSPQTSYVFEACAIGGVLYGFRPKRLTRARRSKKQHTDTQNCAPSTIKAPIDTGYAMRPSSSFSPQLHSLGTRQSPTSRSPQAIFVNDPVNRAVYDSSSGYSLSTDNDQSTGVQSMWPNTDNSEDSDDSVPSVKTTPLIRRPSRVESPLVNNADDSSSSVDITPEVMMAPQLSRHSARALSVDGTINLTAASNSVPSEMSDLPKTRFRQLGRTMWKLRDSGNSRPSVMRRRRSQDSTMRPPRCSLTTDEALKRTAHFLPVHPSNLVTFEDTTILKDLRAGGPLSYDIHLFLTGLCVCNTVAIERRIWRAAGHGASTQFDGVPSRSLEGASLVKDAFLQTPHYTSGRAYELPAVLAAQKMGYQLFAKCKRWIALNINGEFKRIERIYKSDAYLGGESTIVVLKHEGKRGGTMFFECSLKGMLDCIAAHKRLRYTDYEMNVLANRILSRGQIPICIGYRELYEREIRLLTRRVIALSNVVNETKADLIEGINSELVSGCHFLGIIAYRELLQPRVCQTLTSLAEAAVRVWLISSDQEERLFALACGSRLVSSTTRLFRIFGETRRALLAQHRDVSRLAVSKSARSQLALVISGYQLAKILGTYDEMSNSAPQYRSLEIILSSMFWRADTVLFHSMTPSQKGAVVRMVQRHISPCPTVLSIGNSLDDVPMLQESAVGVSISSASTTATATEDLYLREQPYNGTFDSRIFSDIIIPDFQSLIDLVFYHGQRADAMCYLTMRVAFVYGLLGVTNRMIVISVNGSYNGRIASQLMQCIFLLEIFILAIWPQEMSKRAYMSLPIVYTLSRRTAGIRWNMILSDTIFSVLCALLSGICVYVCITGPSSYSGGGRGGGLPRSALILAFMQDASSVFAAKIYAVFVSGSVIRMEPKTWILLAFFFVIDGLYLTLTTGKFNLPGIDDGNSTRQSEPFSSWFFHVNMNLHLVCLNVVFCVLAYLIHSTNIVPTDPLREFLRRAAANQKAKIRQLRKKQLKETPNCAMSVPATQSIEDSSPPGFHSPGGVMTPHNFSTYQEQLLLNHLRTILNPLKTPRLLALMPPPFQRIIRYLQSNGSRAKILLPHSHPIDLASANLLLRKPGELLDVGRVNTPHPPRASVSRRQEAVFMFSPYSLKNIRMSMKRPSAAASATSSAWLLVDDSNDIIKPPPVEAESAANFNKETGNNAGTEMRKHKDRIVTVRLSNEEVATVFDRRRLKFKDQQLEADYQMHRIEHIRKYRVSYRLIFMALSVICIATVIDEMFFISGDLSSAGAVVLFLPYVVSVSLSAASYKENAFFTSYDKLAGTFVVGLLISQLLSDAFTSKDGSPIAAVYMVILFIFFRLPFGHSLVYNCVHFFTFCLRFTLTSKLIAASAVSKEADNPPLGQRNAFKLAESMESITVEKLITYLPVLLGIEVFTGFAAYRLEYDRRKAYLLQYQVEKARKRQIEILNNMLPPFVVNEMIKGKLNANGIPIDLKAEDRGTVSVIFLDVHDFQSIVSQMAPTHLVRILDSLFLCFDKCAEKYGCVKIETVFETFLAASGIHLDECHPNGAGTSHSRMTYPQTSIEDYALSALCMCVLALQSSRHITYVPDADSRRSKRLHVRIGIHAGRVISGVVGAKKPQYALFGDTVNTASRMMSTGSADHIHVSDSFYKLISGSEWDLDWTTREIEVKGKGLMKTHQLNRTDIPDHFLDTNTVAARNYQLNRQNEVSDHQHPPSEGGNSSSCHQTPSSPSPVTADMGSSTGARCLKHAVSGKNPNPTNDDGDNHELLFYQSIHFVSLKFKSPELEKAYVEHYYTSDNNINNVEQALIIFLATYVAQSLVLLYVPRYDNTTSSSQRSITWTVRTSLTGTVLILWLIIHQRDKLGAVKNGGIKWIIFLTNMVSLIAGSAVLLESAWTLDFPEGVSPVWLHLDTLQIFFFTTILHQNSGLLIQQLLFIDAFVNLLCLSFIFSICQRGNVTYEAVFMIPIFTLANLVSVYFREYVDRHTYVVNELMKSAEARGLQLLKDTLPRQVFDELSSERLQLAYLHSRVTFIFADICGFTTWADTVDAGEVVTVLQSLFAKFDRDSSRFGVFKVCTIGDAYVAISEPTIDGLEAQQGSPGDYCKAYSSDPADGAARILALGQCMIKDIVSVREKLHIPSLDMRIGLHHGQCVGGVIGSGRLRYDIWGLDVLAGNLMESNGVPGRLCASQELVDFLDLTFPGEWHFAFHKRVQIAPKCFTNAFLLVTSKGVATPCVNASRAYNIVGTMSREHGASTFFR